MERIIKLCALFYFLYISFDHLASAWLVLLNNACMEGLGGQKRYTLYNYGFCLSPYNYSANLYFETDVCSLLSTTTNSETVKRLKSEFDGYKKQLLKPTLMQVSWCMNGCTYCPDVSPSSAYLIFRA